MATPKEAQQSQELARQAFRGQAWYGPAMLEIIEDLTASEAAERPVAAAHSIWELVKHVTTWVNVVARRLRCEHVEVTGEEDWPPITDTSQAAWLRALDDLHEAHERMLVEMDRISETDVDKAVPGTGYTVRTMLTGIVNHNIYHAGQMAILKRAIRP